MNRYTICIYICIYIYREREGELYIYNFLVLPHQKKKCSNKTSGI